MRSRSRLSCSFTGPSSSPWPWLGRSGREERSSAGDAPHAPGAEVADGLLDALWPDSLVVAELDPADLGPKRGGHLADAVAKDARAHGQDALARPDLERDAADRGDLGHGRTREQPLEPAGAARAEAALLLIDAEAARQPFFLLAPVWAQLPLVALATSAAVIASQALISGAFSLTQQAIQLAFMPRMQIKHTSASAQGQIYIPVTSTTDPRYARPNSDTSQGSWLPSSGTELFAMVDEATASDADYIYATTATICQMGLNPVDANAGYGKTLTIRAKSATGSSLLVTLKQGSTTIATRTLTPSTSFADMTITLTSGEIASITDYTALSVVLESA